MMDKEKGYINFGSLIYFFIGIGVAIGFILFVVLPWLWGFLKPYIHYLTA